MSEVNGQLKWDISPSGNVVTIEDSNVTIQELYGGFGQGQKILTVPQIAMLHVDDPTSKKEVSEKIKAINRLINNNLILASGDTYFEFGIDILDLKQGSSNHLFKSLKDAGIYTQAQIGNAKNLYILSEQGYSLLIHLMNDDKSKIIYKKVIRDYFRIKNIILNKTDMEQQMVRLLGKQERKKTTDTIKFFIDKGDLKHDPSNPRYNAYARETNFIYQVLFGMTAKQIESYLGLDIKSYDTVRNYLSTQDIKDIRNIEGRVGYMMEDGKSYHEIRQRLKQLYPNTRLPQLADKSIPLIERLLK